MPFGRRVRGWVRTCSKLTLLFFVYFWAGAVYKLVYAQTHDLTRFKTDEVPISYYQRQFFLDTLLQQTWVCGWDFSEYMGKLPSLGAIFSPNRLTLLAAYLERRERELASLPERHPRSLFAEEALDDAYFISVIAAVADELGNRHPPDLAISARSGQGRFRWRSSGIPDLGRAGTLARRLADGYPDSPQAPAALLNVARSEAQLGHSRESQTAYRRIAAEYPRAEQAEDAFNQLYVSSQAEGRLEQARYYRRRALDVAEALARERFGAKPLPAKTTLSIMGFRIDLANINLRFQRLPFARDLLATAAQEADRLKGITTLDQGVKNNLRDRRAQIDRTRTELWVAELYEKMKVGVPGPPPRPHEYPVSGKITLGAAPLRGVEVLLSEEPMGAGGTLGGLQALGRIGSVRHRAMTDRSGRYQIEAVPAGKYHVAFLYRLTTPQDGPRRPTLERPGFSDTGGFDGEVTVTDKGVALPPVRFERAVATHTWGEVGPTGKAIRLSWDPCAGAAAYRVEVAVDPQMYGPLFESHRQQQRDGGRGRLGFLWTQQRVTATQADCPLLALAPDVPQAPMAVDYVYRVTALDASGKELAQSAAPLCRFHFGPAARNAMLALNPPNRGMPGGRGRFGIRRGGDRSRARVRRGIGREISP